LAAETICVFRDLTLQNKEKCERGVDARGGGEENHFSVVDSIGPYQGEKGGKHSDRVVFPDGQGKE